MFHGSMEIVKGSPCSGNIAPKDEDPHSYAGGGNVLLVIETVSIVAVVASSELCEVTARPVNIVLGIVSVRLVPGTYVQFVPSVEV